MQQELQRLREENDLLRTNTEMVSEQINLLIRDNLDKDSEIKFFKEELERTHKYYQDEMQKMQLNFEKEFHLQHLRQYRHYISYQQMSMLEIKVLNSIVKQQQEDVV